MKSFQIRPFAVPNLFVCVSPRFQWTENRGVESLLTSSPFCLTKKLEWTERKGT